MNRLTLSSLRVLIVVASVVLASISFAHAQCTDGVIDGSETDVDCGGGACPGCTVGKTCQIDNDCQSQRCQFGVCVCGPGQVSCGGACADLSNDVDNCGSCGHSCGAGASCQNGICNCVAGQVNCGNTCADLSIDSSNCGACGSVCQGGSTCVGGVCQGASGCFDGIKDGSETDVDCGGGTCPACGLGRGCVGNTDCDSQTCQSGLCVCPPGRVNCGGACIDLGSDQKNCGACGNVCQGVCVNGTCQGGSTCSDGVRDGSETDVDCGGGACPACAPGRSCNGDPDCQSQYCQLGLCACQVGQRICGNACVNLSNDRNNCGACGYVCAGTQACIGGTCQAPMGCSDGVLDGSETDVDCGGGTCPACGMSQSCLVGSDCQSLYCIGGICACPAGQITCNGSQCVDLNSDNNNCGACGHQCGYAGACLSARCVCGPGSVVCGASGCVDLQTDAFNCGACGVTCLKGQPCQGGICGGVDTCHDGIQDGNETGVDCGGSCPPCGAGVCVGSAFGDPDQTVTVEIPLGNSANVAGAQVDVLFDPLVLDPVSVQPGADAPAPLWSVDGALVDAGRFRILATSDPPTGLGLTSSQVARVSFHIHATAGPGTSSGLGVAGCVLSDASGVAIPCSLCAAPGHVLVRPATSFQFGSIGSPVGVDAFDPLPFPATVQALDSIGSPATLYGGTAAMDVAPSCSGTVQPASLPFLAGAGSANFTIACCLESMLPATLTPLDMVARDDAIGITGTSDPFAGVAKGDVNADNSVNVLDVSRAVNLCLALPVSGPPGAPPLAFQTWAADMLDQNCQKDGAINVLDVVRIRNKALGRRALCSCLPGPMPKGATLTAAGGPTPPFTIRLEKSGGREILVKVSGAVDLSGLQLELKGAGRKAQVVLDGLTAGRNWQASTTLVEGVLRVAAFSNSASGVSGDGVVLRITGGGNPKITSVVAADSEGRRIPSQ